MRIPARLAVATVALAVVAAGLARLGLAPYAAEAAPAWGGTCLSCHGVDAPGSLTMVGNDGWLDPDESGTGAPDRGPLPVFRVAPGQTVALMATVQSLALGDTYAMAIRRLRHDGVVHGLPLDASPDCSWADWTSAESYLTEPYLSYRWGDGPSLFVHQLTIADGAPNDVFDLVLELAGEQPDGALFSVREHFYLEVGEGVLFSDGFESGDTSAWSGTSGGGR